MWYGVIGVSHREVYLFPVVEVAGGSTEHLHEKKMLSDNWCVSQRCVSVSRWSSGNVKEHPPPAPDCF